MPIFCAVGRDELGLACLCAYENCLFWRFNRWDSLSVLRPAFEFVKCPNKSFWLY